MCARREGVRDPLQSSANEVESSSTPKDHVWRLPVELSDIVFGLLSPIDATCFGLSCKALYEKYKSRKHYIHPIPLDVWEFRGCPFTPSGKCPSKDFKSRQRPKPGKIRIPTPKKMEEMQRADEKYLYNSFVVLGEILREWMGPKYRNWPVDARQDRGCLPAFHYLAIEIYGAEPGSPKEKGLQARYRDYINAAVPIHPATQPQYYVSKVPNPFNRGDKWLRDVCAIIQGTMKKLGLDNASLDKAAEQMIREYRKSAGIVDWEEITDLWNASSIGRSKTEQDATQWAMLGKIESILRRMAIMVSAMEWDIYLVQQGI